MPSSSLLSTNLSVSAQEIQSILPYVAGTTPSPAFRWARNKTLIFVSLNLLCPVPVLPGWYKLNIHQYNITAQLPRDFIQLQGIQRVFGLQFDLCIAESMERSVVLWGHGSTPLLLNVPGSYPFRSFRLVTLLPRNLFWPKQLIVLFPSCVRYVNLWRMSTAHVPIFTLNPFSPFRKMGKEEGCQKHHLMSSNFLKQAFLPSGSFSCLFNSSLLICFSFSNKTLQHIPFIC